MKPSYLLGYQAPNTDYTSTRELNEGEKNRFRKEIRINSIPFTYYTSTQYIAIANRKQNAELQKKY